MLQILDSLWSWGKHAKHHPKPALNIVLIANQATNSFLETLETSNTVS